MLNYSIHFNVRSIHLTYRLFRELHSSSKSVFQMCFTTRSFLRSTCCQSLFRFLEHFWNLRLAILFYNAVHWWHSRRLVLFSCPGNLYVLLIYNTWNKFIWISTLWALCIIHIPQKRLYVTPIRYKPHSVLLNYRDLCGSFFSVPYTRRFYNPIAILVCQSLLLTAFLSSGLLPYELLCFPIGNIFPFIVALPNLWCNQRHLHVNCW